MRCQKFSISISFKSFQKFVNSRLSNNMIAFILMHKKPIIFFPTNYSFFCNLHILDFLFTSIGVVATCRFATPLIKNQQKLYKASI